MQVQGLTAVPLTPTSQPIELSLMQRCCPQSDRLQRPTANRRQVHTSYPQFHLWQARQFDQDYFISTFILPHPVCSLTRWEQKWWAVTVKKGYNQSQRIGQATSHPPEGADGDSFSTLFEA